MEKIPWNKGKTDVYSEDTLRRISESQIGRIPWNKGKTGIYSEATLEKMRLKKLGISPSSETKAKMSKSQSRRTRKDESCLKTTETRRKNHPSWFKESDKEKISNSVKERLKDKECYDKYYNAYLQYIKLSFSDPIMSELWAKKKASNVKVQEYPIYWDHNLRQGIRRLYSFKCQICGHHALAVHHIDYNKFNCRQDNLILLCNRCHMKTNSKKVRNNYHLYFNIMKAEEGGRNYVQSQKA